MVHLAYHLVMGCNVGIPLTGMTSIHCTCVIPGRHRSCGAGLHRQVRVHDLEVGFGYLHRQCLCGIVPTHFVFKGMNSITVNITVQLHRKIMGYGCRNFFIFYFEPQQFHRK
jgi:hypothetical protein